MEIGTGIALGCAILGGVLALTCLIPSKTNNWVTWRAFDTLSKSVNEGFKKISGDIEQVHKRLDELILRKSS